ncbi:MAG: HEPN domain-containing protein, partial [Chloroflexi bacterium]|nr:HEPN domain-containing protein [Chloroflexota bacterium]
MGGTCGRRFYFGTRRAKKKTTACLWRVFHAQQCAEKYIKALLISKGADFPKTHDLLMLSNLCSSNGILLEIDPKHLNTLTDYAVRTRYPGNDPNAEDAKEAIE